MKEKRTEQEIIADLKPVCLCKGIRQGTMRKHIEAGCTTADELRRATGAGSGSCKGERCGPRIRELLSAGNQGGRR